MFYGTSATRYPANIGFTVAKLNCKLTVDVSTGSSENTAVQRCPSVNFIVMEWRDVYGMSDPVVSGVKRPSAHVTKLVFVYAPVVPPY